MLIHKNNTIQEGQKLLQGVVSFGNTDTKQVMKPGMDVFALSINTPFKTIIEGANKGMLYVKDLLLHLNKNTFNWTILLREPFFVPENKKLDDLLVEFQTKKVHLAVVVDEYGFASGLVFLEDIIDEIVGDISDEYGDDDLVFTKIDANNYSFEGKTPLKNVCRIMSVEDETDDFEANKGEAETLTGFVLEISGGLPKIGHEINFKNYVFTIEALDRKRIKQIKITHVNTSAK